jgi:hypothetical protein
MFDFVRFVFRLFQGPPSKAKRMRDREQHVRKVTSRIAAGSARLQSGDFVTEEEMERLHSTIRPYCSRWLNCCFRRIRC